MDKNCKYGIKEQCQRDTVSFEICNMCVTISIHQILEKMILVGKQ